MTFGGVCKISILAQRQQFFVAPLLFLWVMIIHYVLETTTVASVSIVLTGAIIAVYQQFSIHAEDVADGFFDHCRFNGLHLFSYACAKSISTLISTLLPMALMLLVLGIGFAQSLLLFFQLGILSMCIGCALVFTHTSNPLSLLLAWLPLLTAPLVFLVDYFNNANENSLLILLGCDIILISAVCVPFTFHKSYV